MKLKLPEALKSKRATIALSMVGAALLTSASLFATGPDAAPEEIAERAWPVSVTHVQPGTFSPNFTAYAKLESTRVARLRSDLVAPIVDVHVREGDWVEAGDLLVSLDAREANLAVIEKQADLKQAEATLAAAENQLRLEKQSAEHFQSKYQIAQNKLTRHENLMAKKLISKSLLDEVVTQANQASIEFHNHQRVMTDLPNQIAALQASVTKASALLGRAELDLEKTQIRAPFSGPITSVFAAPGDYTNLSVPLIEVADASAAELRVPVPDAYVDAFKQAETETTEILASDGSATFKLARLARHVRQGQTGTDAFFTIHSQDSQRHPLGRVVNLTVSLPAMADLVALPVQAIYENERIYRVTENRLIGLPVARVGERNSEEGGYQILVANPDIQPGDAIITTQLPRAIDGLLVDVANATNDT